MGADSGSMGWGAALIVSCEVDHTFSVNNDLKNLWLLHRLSGRLTAEYEIFLL